MRKIIVSTLVIVIISSTVCAQNKISMPAKQYLLEGVDNLFFVQPVMKYDYLAGDVVRFEGDANYAKAGRLEKSASITSPTNGEVIEVKLYDGQSFEVKDSAKSVICSANTTTDNGPLVIQFFGDSFTKGCYFKDAFLERGLVPNVKLVGMRPVADHQGEGHEGRGGWTLPKYMEASGRSNDSYNPFVQPEGKFKFWGAVEFWRTSVMINITGGKGIPFSTRYNIGEFDTSRFGEDGFLLSPQPNDMMYCGQSDKFVAWNGKRWIQVKEPEQWSFNYGRYLDMWEFDAPDFLVIMLGLNDFRDLSLPFDFETWNAMVETILASYKAAVPTGKLLLSTPCTSCGVLDNDSGAFTTRQNAMMWHVRDNVINHFDCRESEDIYVVDASIAIDNENGYNRKGDLQTGNPHPYQSYPQLGVPIAACVQYLR